MTAPARLIILDRANDAGYGNPVYPDDRPDLHSVHVWAVVDIQAKGTEDWDVDYLAEGLTYDQAVQWTGADPVP